ncbi:MAG: hypothetical protein J2P56_06695, partial [Verrucomicrobia bacterium]|nr:hypothetical protein [Verrucomicrobiota bacterium]
QTLMDAMRDIYQVPGTTEQKLQPARGFDIRCLFASLTISAFLILWITLASGSFNVAAALFLLVLPWVLLGAGGIISAALRFPSFFALDFLLGVAVVSVFVLVWKVFVPLSLWVLLIILLIAIAGIPRLLRQQPRDPLSSLGLLAVIVSLVAATCWSQDLISPTRTVEGGIVFKPGADFFFHSTIVARSLGAQTLVQAGNYEWQGFPAFFYHYASYSLASFLAKVGHVPAYDAVVGFWATFGSFLVGLSSYALARAIWSQGAGLAALMASFLIPDAWLLNVAHPLYGYFWLQQVSPAESYALAIAGTALILIARGASEGRRAWIASGAVLGALVVFFKVQIFVAAFPLLFSFAVVAWPPRRRWRWLIIGACVVAGLVLFPLINRFYVGPNVRFDFSGNGWYWKMLANIAKGTPTENWYDAFRVEQPFPSHLAQAIGLLLINALGIFVVVTPILWLFAAWRKKWEVSESISVAAVVILLAMTFGLGGDGIWSNVTELIHRPFVWAYWLVASLTAGRLFSIAAVRGLRLATAVVIAGIVALMLVPVRFGSGLQPGKWPGPKGYSNMRLDRGFVDCARYIRNQPPINAVAQDSRIEKFPILGGLSERPSFAARLDMWKAVSNAFRKSPYKEQLQKLQSLLKATNIPDLQRSVHETGIRWYVVHPGDPNFWPKEFRDHPIFESNGYKVYDMQRCFDLRG